MVIGQREGSHKDFSEEMSNQQSDKCQNGVNMTSSVRRPTDLNGRTGVRAKSVENESAAGGAGSNPWYASVMPTSKEVPV